MAWPGENEHLEIVSWEARRVLFTVNEFFRRYGHGVNETRAWSSSIRQPWKFLVPKGVPQTVHIHRPQVIMLRGAPRCRDFLCMLGEGDKIL